MRISCARCPGSPQQDPVGTRVPDRCIKNSFAGCLCRDLLAGSCWTSCWTTCAESLYADLFVRMLHQDFCARSLLQDFCAWTFAKPLVVCRRPPARLYKREFTSILRDGRARTPQRIAFRKPKTQLSRFVRRLR